MKSNVFVHGVLNTLYGYSYAKVIYDVIGANNSRLFI